MSGPASEAEIDIAFQPYDCCFLSARPSLINSVSIVLHGIGCAFGRL